MRLDFILGILSDVVANGLPARFYHFILRMVHSSPSHAKAAILVCALPIVEAVKSRFSPFMFMRTLPLRW
jgi:hypothetical protein